MTCDKIRERMPEVAAGLAATAEESQHLASCEGCARQLEEFRRTMALLDEWQAPEPSQYFDVRLQARLREEMSKPQAGWLHWVRRPVLAMALSLVMAVGVGLLFVRGGGGSNDIATVDMLAPGSAVSDLQALEKNHDLYSDFDLLDDLEVQHDVVANP